MLSFRTRRQGYSTLYLDHPSNPKEARSSERITVVSAATIELPDHAGEAATSA